jgi:tungstate transport system substrate-binding protein
MIRVFAIICVLLGGVPAFAQDRFITLQSTTSTQNSGLLDVLIPQFRAQTGIDVRVIAVGTGQALRNAQNGDGDVLLVHDRTAEDQFVTDGFGIDRRDVMYNDFVIVGPANLTSMTDSRADTTAALTQIATSETLFVSRGDDSGTHKAEQRLWLSTGIFPNGPWYREAGAGMGATLNIAIGMGAYTLADRATWTAFGNKGAHQIVVEGDPRLFNPYGVILVNPELHPHVKSDDARAFSDWLVSPIGQAAITAFQIDGKQVFFANAQSSK